VKAARLHINNFGTLATGQTAIELYGGGRVRADEPQCCSIQREIWFFTSEPDQAYARHGHKGAAIGSLDKQFYQAANVQLREKNRILSLRPQSARPAKADQIFAMAG